MKTEDYIGRVLTCYVVNRYWFYEVYDVIKNFKTLESEYEDWIRMRLIEGTKEKEYLYLDEPISNIKEYAVWPIEDSKAKINECLIEGIN